MRAAPRWLARKPLATSAGGLYHFGDTLYNRGDVFRDESDLGYRKIVDWLEGATMPSSCEASVEIGP